MARKPQGGTAKLSTTRKRAGDKAQSLPPSASALGIDDLIGDLADPAPPAPEADLDALLDALADPAPEPAATPAAPPVAATGGDSDLDALLDALVDPAPEPVVVAAAQDDTLDALLADLDPPPPADPAPDLDDLLDDLIGEAPDPLDDLIGDLDAPEPEPLPIPAPARDDLADLVADAPPEPPAPAASPVAPDEVAPVAAAPAPVARKRRALTVPLPRLPALPALSRKVAVGAVVAAFVATNALSYSLGARERPPTKIVTIHTQAPREGLDRYLGEGLDFRIDDKTFFEDDDFRAAVDELVGGPDVQARLAEMMERVRAEGPIRRTGARIHVRACNPQACAQENFVVEYDTANKRVSACFTQPYIDPDTGEATRATSWMYDEKGSREVPACAGYPHPAGMVTPPPPAAPVAAGEAPPGQAQPAHEHGEAGGEQEAAFATHDEGISMAASGERQMSIAERIHARLMAVRQTNPNPAAKAAPKTAGARHGPAKGGPAKQTPAKHADEKHASVAAKPTAPAPAPKAADAHAETPAPAASASHADTKNGGHEGGHAGDHR